jgi:hypothetical protein
MQEIGGGVGATAGAINRGSRPMSGLQTGGSRATSAEGSGMFEDDGMDEFSPRLAKIMRKVRIDLVDTSHPHGQCVSCLEGVMMFDVNFPLACYILLMKLLKCYAKK